MKRTLLIVAAVVVVAIVVYIVVDMLGGDGPILVLKPKPKESAVPSAEEPQEIGAADYEWTVNDTKAQKSGTTLGGTDCELRADVTKPDVRGFTCDGVNVAKIELEDDAQLTRLVISLKPEDKFHWELEKRPTKTGTYTSTCIGKPVIQPTKANEHKLPDELVSYVAPGYVRCYDADDFEVNDSPKLVCLNLKKDRVCPTP